jgi:hypothetical protein
MDFHSFKQSQPAKAVFRAMGLVDELEAAFSWNSLRGLIVDL